MINENQFGQRSVGRFIRAKLGRDWQIGKFIPGSRRSGSIRSKTHKSFRFARRTTRTLCFDFLIIQRDFYNRPYLWTIFRCCRMPEDGGITIQFELKAVGIWNWASGGVGAFANLQHENDQTQGNILISFFFLKFFIVNCSFEYWIFCS